MNPSTASVHAIAHVLSTKLREMADGEDDELTMQIIRYVHDENPAFEGKDVITLPAEEAALITACTYAGVLGVMLERLLYPKAAEYVDENDADIEYVDDLVQEYGGLMQKTDSEDIPADADRLDLLQEALRCSIDARALRMWMRMSR